MCILPILLLWEALTMLRVIKQDVCGCERVFMCRVCVKGVHLTLELVQKRMSLKIRILSYLSCHHMKILKITHNRLKWCNCI